MNAVETLVLVFDADLAAEVEAVARPRPGRGSLRILPTRRAPGLAVAQARSASPEQPLGVIADSETAALEAIAHGADEAMALSQVSVSSVESFLDRVLLRASMRRQDEQIRRVGSHAEKLAALGCVVAGVGHEINNPLSVLTLSLSSARRSVAPLLDCAWELRRLAERKEPIAPQELLPLAATVRRRASHVDALELLDEMVSASDSIAQVVRDLRVFARDEPDEQPTIVDLARLLERVLRMAGREVERRAVIERDYERDLPQLVLPSGRLVQVLMNIIVNAGQAMHEIDRTAHRLRITTRTDDEYVALCISDTGPGIPAESLERVFDPFFTTKRQELGTGLGLSIARTNMRAMGGDLLVESVHGVGATFVCLLPRPTRAMLRNAVHLEAGNPPEAAPLGGSLAVMVVDDDERVLRAYSRFLSGHCRLVIARDGREAIELLTSGSEVDVVVSELDMPELDAPGLHAWLREARPELASRMVVVSDYGVAQRYAAFLSAHGVPMLRKPVDGASLLRVIRTLTAVQDAPLQASGGG